LRRVTRWRGSGDRGPEWIDKAIELVLPHAPRVCLRGDTGFPLTACLDRQAEKVDFIFGMDNNPALRKRAETLEEAAWKPLRRPAPHQSRTGATQARRENHKQRIVTERGHLDLRLNHEHVAELTYKPGKRARSHRLVVVGKNISRARRRAGARRRDPLLLLHHHPRRPDRRAGRRAPTSAATRKTSSDNSNPA
jgi:hypothetical protein